MIEKLTIENYKSIQHLEFELGQITVLIGANGSGKSNILEAIALSSAAANDKLDNEFLISRGIRVTDDPRFMRAAFNDENVNRPIKTLIKGGDLEIETVLQKKTDDSYSPWFDSGLKPVEEDDIVNFFQQFKNRDTQELSNFEDDISKFGDFVARYFVKKSVEPLHLDEFLIYSPEIYSLRTFEEEGQIQPLGRNGEGLFKLLKVLSSRKNKKRFEEIKSKLKLIDWFSDFDVANDLSPQEKRLQIKDKYLDEKLKYFDQKSSNEGFLFLLFYLCLFVSDDTPRFFAIDNIDVSLNPKLCSQLMIELNKLAVKYKKQVVFTTHSPAILDGLNLTDKNQKLYVVSRNKLGQTKINRIEKPKSIKGKEPVKLSEAFLRGYLGGLPNNF
jgi:predicted ATPase